MKRIVVTVVKGIAGTAAVVFIFVHWAQVRKSSRSSDRLSFSWFVTRCRVI